MKRNLKDKIENILINELGGEEHSSIIYRDFSEEVIEQLLSLFSDTIDKVLDPKPSRPKGGKKVTDIIEITIYNYDKRLRDRKKDLLDNTKTKEQT